LEKQKYECGWPKSPYSSEFPVEEKGYKRMINFPDCWKVYKNIMKIKKRGNSGYFLKREKKLSLA
jgi:hypothetical protein